MWAANPRRRGLPGIRRAELATTGTAGLPNVVTSLEFERMLNASGVTRDTCVRPSDMKSRGELSSYNASGREARRPALLQPFLLHERGQGLHARQQHIPSRGGHDPHTDCAAFGKGFDDFRQAIARERKRDVIRGRPAKVERAPGETRSKCSSRIRSDTSSAGSSRPRCALRSRSGAQTTGR